MAALNSWEGRSYVTTPAEGATSIKAMEQELEIQKELLKAEQSLVSETLQLMLNERKKYLIVSEELSILKMRSNQLRNRRGDPRTQGVCSHCGYCPFPEEARNSGTTLN